MSGKEKKNGSLNKVICIGTVVLSALVTLLFLCLLILVGTAEVSIMVSCAWLVFSVILLVLSKRKYVFLLSIAGCIIALPLLGLFAMSNPSINSSSPWKYSLQRQYIQLYGTGYSEDLPETLPEDIGDYKFEHKPTIMQGQGHCSIRYTAPADTIRAFEEQYAPSAIYTMPLSRFDNDGFYSGIFIEKVSPEATVGYTGESYLGVYIDNDFWKDTPDATVYVLSAVHDWNHPHSKIVIISSDHSKIQFSQY